MLLLLFLVHWLADHGVSSLVVDGELLVGDALVVVVAALVELTVLLLLALVEDDGLHEQHDGHAQQHYVHKQTHHHRLVADQLSLLVHVGGLLATVQEHGDHGGDH